MKKILSILLPSLLMAGVFNCSQAQRGGGRDGENRDGRRSESSQRNVTQRTERVNSSERPYRNRISESGSFRQNNNFSITQVTREDVRANAINSNRTPNTVEQRNEVALAENRSRYNGFGATQQGINRESAFGNQRIGNERYVSHNVYNNYNYYRGGYYPRVWMTGPRYSVIPRSFISINFGGYPYYYNDGLFYGSYGGYYQPLFPPPGISIRILPFGYRRIFIGADPFYYYNGIYYRERDHNDYEVVDAPMGATVSNLPKGAKSVVLNGEKLYELNGTYYKEDRNYKGETVYTVVGKNGEVNNLPDGSANNTVPPAALNNGDVVNQLPEGSKIVTINGEKLYVSPDDTYYKEESDGNIVQYKVVGK